jgi:hypothetical protein
LTDFLDFGVECCWIAFGDDGACQTKEIIK